jgi:3-hydroxyacyl-[acyl-carrier-protein] dehydratase
MTIEEIKHYLPHRYPFLLIDRVTEFEKNKRIVALKNVTMNEPFFPGHFPHYHVMPGVLIVEAMAQAAAVLSMRSLGQANDGRWVYYFGGQRRRALQEAGGARRPAGDGGDAGRARAGWAFSRRGRVNGVLVAEAEMMCALREIEQK